MLAAVIEKFSFAVAVIVLFLQNRVAPMTLSVGMIDLLLGLSFVTAYFLTPDKAENK